MRLLNVFFIALIALALIFVGFVFVQNYPVMSQNVVLWESQKVRVSTLLVLVFLLGFVLNLIYTGVMELRRLVKGLNASAATRAGKRLSVLMQEARELAAHGMAREALASADQILQEREDYLPAGLLKVELLLKLGETDEAVKLLEAMIQARPDLAEPRYLLAEALVARRQSALAIPHLQKVASDHPKQALRALRRLRALHTEAGAWEEALEAHKKVAARFAAEMGPAERAQGLALTYETGLLKVEADQFREAAQVFQQVLKEDPAFVPAYLSLGRCMVLQDQEAQGVEIWLEGFRATGEGALLQEVEDYFIQSGKPEEGLQVMQRVAATSEFQTTAKFFLGKLYYRLEILDEALDLFQEVRAQVVYSPILFFFIAKIHARRGRLDAALNEYRQLLRNLGVLKLRFECSHCGQRTADHADRCEACGTWNASRFLFRENELPEVALRGGESGQWLS